MVVDVESTETALARGSVHEHLEFDRPIRFESAEQFRERPLYRDRVDGTVHRTLLRRVGGYSFPPGKYVNCGLKGCRQTHGKGLVVLLEGDIETNVGHCCGSSNYGLQWDEMEAAHDREERAFAIKDLADRVYREKAEKLTQANVLLSSVITAAQRLVPIIEMINSDKKLEQAINTCKRSGGVLIYHRELTRDERELSPGQRTAPERMGQVEGLVALDMGNLERELRLKVIGPLANWPELEAKPKYKKLERMAVELREMADVMERAHAFVNLTQRLIQKENWLAFERFCVASGVSASWRSINLVRKLAGLPPRSY